MNAAEKITRQSGSNLALAFVSLGREQRRDITTFYAFCRLIDDIADAPHVSADVKHRELEEWRAALVRPMPDEPPLAGEVRALITRYRLKPEMLGEIIDGVEMDLTTTRYETWDELRVYCYRVASAVGLVSIEIFGYRNPACRDYAIDLGLALQTTNIIRDVAKDLTNGRIYLPRDEMRRFNYSETDLQQRTYNDRFIQLMEFQTRRAREFFARAKATLPAEDRRSMVAAEIMAGVYGRLLNRIAADRWRVFEKDYALGKVEKAAIVARETLKSFRMRKALRPSILKRAK